MLNQAQFFLAIWTASDQVKAEQPVREEVWWGLAQKYAVALGLTKGMVGKTRMQFLKEDPVVRVIVVSAMKDNNLVTRSLLGALLEAWESYKDKNKASTKEIPPFED